MMTPTGDGRSYACQFCNARAVVAVDGGQIAAGMRLDLGNVDAFMGQLASTLHAGFAECTRIQAYGAHVQSIDVNLDPDGFSIRREPSGVVAQHKKMVRGVALKTTTVPVEKWVELLTKALATRAGSTTRAAWALARLTGNEHAKVR